MATVTALTVVSACYVLLNNKLHEKPGADSDHRNDCEVRFDSSRFGGASAAAGRSPALRDACPVLRDARPALWEAALRLGKPACRGPQLNRIYPNKFEHENSN
jgi:hypothetical protein